MASWCGYFAAATSIVVAMSAEPATARDQYEYDALGRLIRVAYASGAIVQYSYDAAGNRSQVISNLPALSRDAGSDSEKASAAPGDGRDPPPQDNPTTGTGGARSVPTSATLNPTGAIR
jgi:YD repeat-containing protein